jgi:hypothetical protein
MFNVDPSVPIKPSVLATVNAFDVFPPETENPVVKDENETPLIVLPVNADVILSEATVPNVMFDAFKEVIPEPLPSKIEFGTPILFVLRK